MTVSIKWWSELFNICHMVMVWIWHWRVSLLAQTLTNQTFLRPPWQEGKLHDPPLQTLSASPVEGKTSCLIHAQNLHSNSWSSGGRTWYRTLLTLPGSSFGSMTFCGFFPSFYNCSVIAVTVSVYLFCLYLKVNYDTMSKLILPFFLGQFTIQNSAR